jgi:hypothetical protein
MINSFFMKHLFLKKLTSRLKRLFFLNRKAKSNRASGAPAADNIDKNSPALQEAGKRQRQPRKPAFYRDRLISHVSPLVEFEMSHRADFGKNISSASPACQFPKNDRDNPRPQIPGDSAGNLLKVTGDRTVCLTPHFRAYNPLDQAKTLSVDALKKVRYYIDCGDDDFLFKGSAAAPAQGSAGNPGIYF